MVTLRVVIAAIAGSSPAAPSTYNRTGESMTDAMEIALARKLAVRARAGAAKDLHPSTTIGIAPVSDPTYTHSLQINGVRQYLGLLPDVARIATMVDEEINRDATEADDPQQALIAAVWRLLDVNNGDTGSARDQFENAVAAWAP